MIKLFYNLGTQNQKVSFLFSTLIHRHTFERVDVLTVSTFLPPSLTWPIHSGFHSRYFTEIGFSTSVMMSILPYLMAKSFFFLNLVHQHISTSLWDTSGTWFPGQHTPLAGCLSHCLLFWVLAPFWSLQSRDPKSSVLGPLQFSHIIFICCFGDMVHLHGFT